MADPACGLGESWLQGHDWLLLADRRRARLCVACGPRGGGLGLDELACLVDDDGAARDLRRVGKRRLELLLAQPAAGNAGRLVGLRGGVEEADGGHDAVAG